MDIDIANTLVEHARRTDWIEHVITFISVFLGAFLAYRLNLNLEMRKAKRQMRSAFCTLSSQTFLNLDVMLSYKRHVLDKIKQAYEKSSLDALSINIRGPIVSFDFDMNKYIFLNDCNRCFLPELRNLQSAYENLKFLWATYTQRLFSAQQQYIQGNTNAWEEMKREFLFDCNCYNKICIRLYHLNKHFSECYKRFFNVNYYDNMEEDDITEEELLKAIPDALSEKDLLKQEEYFNKYWAPDHTLWEGIKFKYRKLKYHLKGIKIYFFGRGKPKTKRKDKRKK